MRMGALWNGVKKGAVRTVGIHAAYEENIETEYRCRSVSMLFFAEKFKSRGKSLNRFQRLKGYFAT